MRLAGFSLGIVALLSACATPAGAKTAPFVLQPGQIDLASGPDGNTEILDAPDGLIVVDTGRHEQHAERILAYAREHGKPIAAIVNAHWHLDHTTGNRDLRLIYPEPEVIATAAGAGALSGFLAPGIERARIKVADPSLASEAKAGAARMLAAVEDRASFLPRRPVEHDEARVIAGRRIALHVARAAATEADLWLGVPDEHLVIVGDLVVAQAPFFDTGCEEGWSRALDAIAASEWDTLIPGHGEPMSRTMFARWRKAFDGFLACGRSTEAPSVCADRWATDAAGFYAPEEAAEVGELIRYYVSEVLRAPTDKRMAYCHSGNG